MAQTADRDANQALRARFDDVHRQYERIRSGMDEMQRQMAELTVTAESENGLVEVTVGARGQVLDVKIDPRVYRQPDEAELGRQVLGAIQKASAQVTDQIRELMATVLPAGSGAMRFLDDNNLGSLLHHSDEIMRKP